MITKLQARAAATLARVVRRPETLKFGATQPAAAETNRRLFALGGLMAALARLCDELTLFTLTEDENVASPGCLVIDQDVFIKLTEVDGYGRMALIGMPVVLMVGQKTKRLIDRARAAGVTRVVEKPLVGGVLFDEIRDALGGGLDS